MWIRIYFYWNNPYKKNQTFLFTSFLLGDLIIDLMHYNEHKPKNEFLDSLPPSYCLPYITQLVDIEVISEPLLTIFSVMLSQKTSFLVILQLQYLSTYHSSVSHVIHLLIHPLVNLMAFGNFVLSKFIKQNILKITGVTLTILRKE